MKATRYRCPTCQAIVETDPDDTMPVCNTTDRCGFLFDTDLVPNPPAPARKGLKFKETDVPDGGYQPGDERVYDVYNSRGVHLGFVEPTWRLPHTPGDPPVSGWAFQSNDGRLSGEGRYRADAVIDAYTTTAP